MPRVNYKRNKKYVYHKGKYSFQVFLIYFALFSFCYLTNVLVYLGDYDDPDHPAHTHDYPHFRNDWNSGRRAHRNAQRPNANAEMIRRVMFVDGQGPSHTQTVLAPVGETWMRASVANAASLPMEFFKDSISTAIGSPIRVYNYMMKGEGCVFFFKLRSKRVG